MTADRPIPPGAPRYSRAQRRALAAVAGLAVAALAGGAFTLTYDVLRDLAVAGHASRRWAPVYPAMADLLTAMTILSLVVTRQARWWTRTLRWALLLVLVAGVAAISVQRSVKGYGALPDEPLDAGVAVAPHVLLVIAVWLWLTMFKQLRTARHETPPEPAELPDARDTAGRLGAGLPKAPEPLWRQQQRGHVKKIEALPAARSAPALPTPDAEPAPDRTDDGHDAGDADAREVTAPMTTRPDLVMPPKPRVPSRNGDAPDDAALETTATTALDPLPELPANATEPADEPAPAPDSNPGPADGETIHGIADEGDELDLPPADRAEDPDAGDDDERASRGRHRLRGPSGDTEPDFPVPAPVPDGEASEAHEAKNPGSGGLSIWDWNPPSGSFRSSPTPPAE